MCEWLQLCVLGVYTADPLTPKYGIPHQVKGKRAYLLERLYMYL